MSRVGNMPVDIPDKVTVKLAEDNTVTVKGPLGELAHTCHPDMQIAVADAILTVARPSDQRQHRALHGMTRSLIANMVEGVTNGFEKRLLINGVGYRAEVSGKSLTLRIGFSHPVQIEPPADVEFEVIDNTTVVIRGIDKQVVGQLAADIRHLRPVEPYKGRGIRYVDERVRHKAGKARAGEM